MMIKIPDFAKTDGIFFGPSDLAASMGLLGRSSDAQVQQAIADGIRQVREAGKAAGVLTVDAVIARKQVEIGALFVAVGIDTSLLVRAASDLAAQFTASPEGLRTSSSI